METPDDPYERARGVVARSREARLVLQRRRLARLRQQEALLAQTAQRLADGAALLRSRPARALLVLPARPAREQLAGELARRGVDVIGLFADGPLGVQLAGTAQPELVVVEQALPELSAVQVLGSVRRLCAHAHLAAVVDDADVAAVLAAGANAVFTRGAPAGSVARELTALVRAR